MELLAIAFFFILMNNLTTRTESLRYASPFGKDEQAGSVYTLHEFIHWCVCVTTKKCQIGNDREHFSLPPLEILNFHQIFFLPSIDPLYYFYYNNIK